MVDIVQNEKKKKKKRCPMCNKKIKLTDMECRCGNIYCMEHRLPELHNCCFNYKKEGKEMLNKNNPQIIKEKILKI